jgi:hypothetical protein
MPWTFAHPAAVLPFKHFFAGLLLFPALIIGSLLPDVGYYFGRFDIATYAHSLIGLFSICLPMGICLFLILRLLYKPVVHLLPQPHRGALLSLAWADIPISVTLFFKVSASLLLGALTHIIWDSFTHKSGFFVKNISALQLEVFNFLGHSFQAYNVLQHISSLFGLIFVIIFYVNWLHRAKADEIYISSHNDRWRYFLLAALVLISISMALPLAYFASGEYLNISALIFRFMVFFTSTFFVLLPCAAAVFSKKRYS